jgi:hypothetical protein
VNEVPAVDRDDSTTSLAQRMKAFWEVVGAHPRPGVSIAEIEAFEAKRGIRLTRELRDYFLVVDGMENWETDSQWLTHFFSLGSLRTVREEIAHYGGVPDYREVVNFLEDPDHTFVIADIMLRSHFLVVRLTSEPVGTSPVLETMGAEFNLAAPSFNELARRYLADPDGCWMFA